MITIRQMEEVDKHKVVQFVEESGLSGERLKDATVYLLENPTLSGVMGVEKVGKNALLRSFVLSNDVDKYLLYDFFQTVLGRIESEKVETLYLITNHRSSLPFFQLFGFQMGKEEEVSDEVKGLSHYRYAISQQNATILYTRLSPC